ncbi:MAG: hypothetical protein ACO1TE_10935 [Prosthecobacter sp.]
MNLSASQLRRAATLQEKIEEMQQELAALLGGAVGTGTSTGKRRGRGKAKAAASAVEEGAKPAKRKSGISAAGRKRIAAAQKARWAKAKAEAAATEKKAK